ncbi:MAG: DUF4465 domain-containing protein [Prevotella sp.]|nr:DUF4465 domain-containing protein [Prevotella sp.]
MKKIFTFVICALLATAAWADVITLDINKPMNPASLEFDDNGIWTGCYNDEDYTWLEFGGEDGEFMLSHLIDGEGASWGGYYWDGFTPAIGGDQADHSDSWTTKFGGCMAGGGCVINEDGTVSADPEKPYFVAYYSSWTYEGPSNQVMFVDKDGNTEFEPVGVYVCNHPWPYYGCVHGDGFGSPFVEGDYFEIIAHGVASDGSETTVSMNLVEFTDGELKAVNDWTFFDLSSLGKVESVYFTLNSTDIGDYGMNTAAYFCMDNFQVKVADSGVEPIVTTGNILDVTKSLNPETIEYDETGMWTECYNDVDYTWLEFDAEDGEFMLSHLIDGEGASWGGMYWDGFTPAIGGDKVDHSRTYDGGWTKNFSGCMAGGGCVVSEDGTVTADPEKPYIVAYYSSWTTEGPSNQVMFIDKDGNTEFEPVGVYVCNHPWAYYNCLNGDGAARAFAEGDYFEITAHGVAADGSEKTVTMNLVEFTDGELKAANDWTFFDLSSLGKVESVYFTLNSTDTGDWGMNTAAYFCMDRFEVKVGESGDPTSLSTMKADKVVTAVRYSNLAGMTSDKPFNGVNVVVFTYSDGTSSSKVVIKR